MECIFLFNINFVQIFAKNCLKMTKLWTYTENGAAFVVIYRYKCSSVKSKELVYSVR